MQCSTFTSVHTSNNVFLLYYSLRLCDFAFLSPISRHKNFRIHPCVDAPFAPKFAIDCWSVFFQILYHCFNGAFAPECFSCDKYTGEYGRQHDIRELRVRVLCVRDFYWSVPKIAATKPRKFKTTKFECQSCW